MISPYLRWHLFLYLLIFSFFANAQEDAAITCASVCCSKDPTPSGIMISHLHGKNEFMFSYRYMRMEMGRMIGGSAPASDVQVFENYLMSSQSMHMDMHMLMGMVGVSNRITLMGMFNYNFNSMSMNMLPGSTHMHVMNGMPMDDSSMDMEMKTSGISDAKIYALFGLINGLNHHLVLSGGFSLPIGNIQEKGNANSMYPGIRLPYVMQLGSGTWDVLPGITWIYNKNRLALSSQITAIIRTGYNKAGYKFGNEGVSNTWVAYQWLPWLSSSFRIEGNISDRIKGSDALLYSGYEPAANPFNYGNKKMLGFIGAKLHLNGILPVTSSIGAEYGLPFYQYANGIQMRIKSYFNLSVNISF